MNHVATQEVAQVTKGRSGGSAKVKAKRRELQMKSADMLQSFFLCLWDVSFWKQSPFSACF